MKTILVPTDFSETAFGAAVYATEFAASISAKVLLFHAYHPPLPSTGADYAILPDLNLDNENLLLLENFKKELIKKTGLSVDITCEVKLGFAVDEIVEIVNVRKPDIIVMGISGGGRVSEFILGSITTAIIQKTNIPAIIVPPKAVFKKPASLVFACDYKASVSERVTANLIEFVHLLHAKLSVLNLEKTDERLTFEKAVNGVELERALSTVTHTVHLLPSATDIATEMNDFVDSHEATMLVMVPHRHTFMHRLFHESNTKHLSFHSHVPILTLHE